MYGEIWAELSPTLYRLLNEWGWRVRIPECPNSSWYFFIRKAATPGTKKDDEQNEDN